MPPARFAFAIALAMACLFPNQTQAAQTTARSDPEYLMDTWETEAGLPENSATAIVQTPDGYLWFGTFNGLVRFNGVEFTVFNPSNTPQLPSAGIVNLHLGRDGRLWVSTYRGLVVRDGDQWQQLHSEDGWNGDYARTFAERSNGDLLVTAFNGKLFEFSSGRFAELPSPPGEKGQGYFGGADEDGHWWAVQNKFVGRWENGQWVPMISPSQEVAGEAVGCAPARDGGLWVLLGVELRKLRRGMEVSRVTLSEPPGGTWSLSEDSQGNVWIATYENGVCRVATDGTVTRWNSARGWFDRGRCVFEDRERNLWLGTSGDGLRRLAPRRFQFFDLHGGRNGLPVQSLSLDATGGLWVGTYGRGLFLLNENGTTNVALPQLAKHQLYLKSVLADHSGRLWLGTSDDAVWLVEKGDIRHLPPAQTGGHNIHALFEDSRSNVWISGGSGVAVFDGKASKGCGPGQGLPVGTVSCFAEDSTGALWLSNGNGVFRRERDENFAEVTDATGKSIRGIGCLKAGADGSVWLGSADQGLIRWKERKLVVLGLDSGFPVAAVHGLVEDNDGFLWMTSISSVVRARHSDLQALADGRAAQLTCQVFDAGDGLPYGEFTTGRQPTCARDARGRLWFATTKGVAMTDPSALRLNEMPPPVRVEGVSFYRPAPSSANAARMRDHGDVVPSKLPDAFEVPLALPAGSGRIEIQYAALSFVAPDKVRFQVRLEGQDGDWQDAGSRRSVYFHELPPGNHVFRVRAANNDGVWNEAGASLAFTVLPFYWQTTWFRLLAAVGLAGGGAGSVWAVVRGRLRRHREELEHQRVLTDNQQRVDLAASAANLGLWERNLVNHQIWASDQWRAIFGFERSAHLQLDLILQRVHPADRESVRHVLDDALQDRAGYETEFRIVLPDSRERWVASKGKFEFDGQGSPVLMRGVSVDITGRKEAELELEERRGDLAHLSRVTMLGELSGSLAHELNQPLTAILSNAQAAEHYLAEPEPDLGQLREILADIVAEDERAGEVIRRLRLLLKKGVVEFRMLNANEVVQGVLKLSRSDLMSRGVIVETALAPDLPPLRCDVVQLQQVLLNLIVNACDAMAGNPGNDRRLTVRTLQADGGLRIEVSDNGCGLPAAGAEQAFERYFTTKPHGLGLGLSVCRAIVTAHGGTMGATNNAGKGATFFCILPLAKESCP